MKIDITYTDGTEESLIGDIDFNDSVTAQFVYTAPGQSVPTYMTVPWVSIRKIETHG